jgi:hypothetical protein
MVQPRPVRRASTYGKDPFIVRAGTTPSPDLPPPTTRHDRAFSEGMGEG